MASVPALRDAPTPIAIIDRIYEASADPKGSEACFEVLCRATGSMGATFRNLDNPVHAICTRSMAEASLAYSLKWWRHDVFLGTLKGRPATSGVVLDSDIDPDVDRATHPFFQDFLRARGLGSFAAYFSPPIFESRFVLVAHRGFLAGPFNADQLKALAYLAPHVARALAIAGQITLARSKDTALLSILDKLTYGAMIIGRGGKVVAMNDAATSMLDDGLTLIDGALHETFSNARGAVDRLVKLAFADESGASKNALIHRPSGRKPIVLQGLSFPNTGSNLEGLQRGETILLMMIDTEISGAMSQMSVVQSFGLTTAEAKVATLVGSGISPTEAAEQLGSAAGTVRVQLKNVFNKLDIKRQSELVRLMAKLEVLGS